jgi:hypothetical protein
MISATITQPPLNFKVKESYLSFLKTIYLSSTAQSGTMNFGESAEECELLILGAGRAIAARVENLIEAIQNLSRASRLIIVHGI